LRFIAHLYEANGGTDMEVLACFRPGFFNIHHDLRLLTAFLAVKEFLFSDP